MKRAAPVEEQAPPAPVPRVMPTLVMPSMQAHEVELVARLSTAELSLGQALGEIAALKQQRLMLAAATVGLPVVVWLVMRKPKAKPKTAPVQAGTLT